MKKFEILNLVRGLDEKLLESLTGSDLLYTLFKNIAVLKEEAEALAKANPKGSKAWQAFIKKAGDSYEGSEFEEHLMSLEPSNKELFEERVTEITKHNQFLQKESNVKILTVSKSALPENLSYAEMKALFWMVK